ncbi:MAG: hypothetical protein A2W07_06845 [candidate division Zixibacteria bacterium RBG_16_43_9]|nr:MAG: hypothetical protein A2W07_06845 [candidate division Zixibacteria bacterium RBG_16_43_9]
MLFWSTMLFILGVLAFLDAIFNYGEIFRQVNSFMFMLISLGVLIRLRQERVDAWKAKANLTEPVSREEKKTATVMPEKKEVKVA